MKRLISFCFLLQQKQMRCHETKEPLWFTRTHPLSHFSYAAVSEFSFFFFFFFSRWCNWMFRKRMTWALLSRNVTTFSHYLMTAFDLFLLSKNLIYTMIVFIQSSIFFFFSSSFIPGFFCSLWHSAYLLHRSNT